MPLLQKNGKIFGGKINKTYICHQIIDANDVTY